MDPQKLLIRGLISAGSSSEIRIISHIGDKKQCELNYFGYPSFTSYSIHDETLYLYSWNYDMYGCSGTLIYIYYPRREQIRFPYTSFHFFPDRRPFLIYHPVEGIGEVNVQEGIEEIPVQLFEEWWLPYSVPGNTKATK